MKNRKILIVEDQLIIALDLKNSLEGLGYEVLEIVNTGEDCIEYVNKIRPDLVLMDIMLPGKLDGIATAAYLSDELKNPVPVIYLTAHSDEKSVERANLTSPYGYIVKPIEDKELYTTIEIALNRFELDMEIKSREKKFRTLFEESIDPIFTADENGIIGDVNGAMSKLFDIERDGLIGRELSDLFEDIVMYYKIISHADANGSVRDFETKMIGRDSRRLDVIISLKRYDDSWEGVTGYQGILRDISEQKKYIHQIIESQRELRNLTAHIESLREKERTDISREIHDVLGQSLTALRIDLSWLKKRISKDDVEQVDKIEIMDNLINEIIITVRRLSASLRPGILDDLGLSAAIEWQIDEFRKRTGYRCSVETDELVDLSEEKAVACFRILQESLNNVVKHAGATSVNVSLKRKCGVVEMVISDNGKGISVDGKGKKGSYGIIGMRERVQSLKGNLTVDGEPGSGTVVTVQIPS